MYRPVEDYPRDLAELERRFATEEACRRYLAQLRWPAGFRCPRCRHEKAWPVRAGRLWHCAACGDGYDGLRTAGYRHRATVLREHPAIPDLLPRVHRVVGLLKRWLLGTHQGGVSAAHLDYYLDEFTFRFNRRRSRHRGKLFYRLAQQAVAVGPRPFKELVASDHNL